MLSFGASACRHTLSCDVCGAKVAIFALSQKLFSLIITTLTFCREVKTAFFLQFFTVKNYPRSHLARKGAFCN